MDVTLYAICKNEKNNVKKFLESSKKFSHVIVVDTGSTDNTVELLRESGISVYEFIQDEFNFAKARNYALSLVETDWALSLDFNENLEDFFLEGLGALSKEFTKFQHLRFDILSDGEIYQSNEVHTRFHRTKSYYWRNAVHEIPFFVPTEEYPEEISLDTTIKITKNIENIVSKQLFYLDICEREFRKDSKNWYYAWFIFLHYFKIGDLHKALDAGNDFLNSSKPYSNSFRIDIFIKCSIILFKLGDHNKSATYAIHALSEAMSMGQVELNKAFGHLLELGKLLKSADIIIFSSAFSMEALKLNERKDAIEFLYNMTFKP